MALTEGWSKAAQERTAAALPTVRPLVVDESSTSTSSLPDRAVLHVVGRITNSVLSFLGPMTDALLDEGSRQIVVLLDAPELRGQLARFDQRVELVRVHVEPGGWRHWGSLRRAVKRLVAEKSIIAVHYHGLMPWALGAGQARARGQGASVYLSPHGSRLLWLIRMVAPLSSRAPYRGGPSGFIASSRLDAEQLTASGIDSVLVEGAVGDAFFAVPRNESPHSLVIAGNHRRTRDGVDLASRIAVVFGASELKLAFDWCGPVSTADAARLAAAHVGSCGVLDDGALANRLAAGWVFMAPGTDPHFPVLLAQAMAVGLPCLVLDTPMNQVMVDHDVSGLVYRTQEEALDMLSLLIDSPALRQRLGESARQRALQRFSIGRFRERMRPAYGPLWSV